MNFIFLLLIFLLPCLPFPYWILGSCIISYWYWLKLFQTELEVALVLIENLSKFYCKLEVVIELRMVCACEVLLFLQIF